MVEILTKLLAEAVRRKVLVRCIYVDPTSYDSLVMEIAKENPELFNKPLFGQEVDVRDLEFKKIPVYCDREKDNRRVFIEFINEQQ